MQYFHTKKKNFGLSKSKFKAVASDNASGAQKLEFN